MKGKGKKAIKLIRGNGGSKRRIKKKAEMETTKERSRKPQYSKGTNWDE